MKIESRNKVVIVGIVAVIIVVATIAVLLSCMNMLPATGVKNPQDNPSLDDLNKALSDPEVVELLGNRNLTSIGFSKFENSPTEEDYTQIVFHPEDPDPDDRLFPSMIVVQVNASGQVFSAYETYPAYRQLAVGE
ncbi:hypothetical protein [Methanolacinia paynteri]|uniref:hypothetical protein n=1 Tax=Methanolacinia paynteri TaxID=230356 RepID=UPI00064EEA35|nr:hypothetical protein [Methanolacinia paynteri]